jgi:hypothetical protein
MMVGVCVVCRESIEMGQVRISSSELRAIISTLSKDFTSAFLFLSSSSLYALLFATGCRTSVVS